MKMKYFAGATLVALSFTAISCQEETYDIATGNIISTVTTGSASVTATTATITGTVLDLSSQQSSAYKVGTVYSTSSDPTASGTKVTGTLEDSSTGAVTTTISGLTTNVTYYYATYVTLQSTVTVYGEVKTFVTTDADIAAADASSITASSAVLGGQASASAGVINSGAIEVEYGIKLSTSSGDVKNGRDYSLTSSDSNFSITVNGLLPGTTYYYAAYFVMDGENVYSEVKSFTTDTYEMEYVDLGLSVLWAAYNLGAESESGYGGLYGYGDVTGLLTSTSNSDYAGTDISGTDSDIVNSIAAYIDGDSQRVSQMPTAAQFAELISSTTATYTTVDGVAGYRFTANNGNSIFLPAAGYRDGKTTTEEGLQGLYWSGSIYEVDNSYGNTMKFTASSVAAGVSQVNLGLAVRPVRPAEPLSEYEFDDSSIVFGNIEGAGTFRIELWNAYGATSGYSGASGMADLEFNNNMVLQFTLSGISDNLIDGAAGTYYGGFEFADADWWPDLWSDFQQQYDCKVTGDGTYTIYMETGGNTSSGAVVFCIDIGGLAADIKDMDAVSVSIDKIALDVPDSQMQYYIDNDAIAVGDLESNGNIRIELWNAYGPTSGYDGSDGYMDMVFSGYQIVTFTIEGIDGNFIDGAAGSYTAGLSYAASGWWPSNWAENDFANATVTGDGTYTVFAPLDCNTCTGAVVWVIDITGLGKDLVDSSLVTATIDSIVIPSKQ